MSRRVDGVEGHLDGYFEASLDAPMGDMHGVATFGFHVNGNTSCKNFLFPAPSPYSPAVCPVPLILYL